MSTAFAQEPDFSKYDAAQLRQVLGRIDRERFPERAAAVEALLVERERAGAIHADNATAARAPKADPAGHVSVMRRVALVLVAAGLVQLAYGIWQVPAQAGAFSFNFGATIVLGLLLLTGSLRVAVVMRWLGWLTLPGMVAAALAAYAIPPDLLEVELRLAPWQFAAGVLITVFPIAVAAWVVRQLGSPKIAAARAFEGRRAWDMRIPLVVGVVGSILIQVWLFKALNGPDAQYAEQLAAAQVAGDHKYRVVQLNFMSGPSGTRYHATVQVWNRDGVGYTTVNWQAPKE